MTAMFLDAMTSLNDLMVTPIRTADSEDPRRGSAANHTTRSGLAGESTEWRATDAKHMGFPIAPGAEAGEMTPLASDTMHR
jgi:hypothetical protein